MNAQLKVEDIEKYGINDPVLQAVSARVKWALVCLNRGDIEGARKPLEMLERCLPMPSRQNWLATKGK